MSNTAEKKKRATEKIRIDQEDTRSLQPPQTAGFLQNPLIHILLIAVLGTLAYSNTFSSPFQFDDQPQVLENPLLYNLQYFFSDARGYDYVYNPRRVVGYLTFALNYHVGGADVTGYHIVNLFIHLMNALMVYFIVQLTFRTQSMYKPKGPAPPDAVFIALFSALLFVSHPLQTQAVTYIVQRFASLATFFYLLCLIMYIKGRLTAGEPKNNGHRTEGAKENKINIPLPYAIRAIGFYLFSLVSAVLAMMTKEIAFTLPLMIVLYELTFFKSTLKNRLLFILPIMLTLIIIPAGLLQSDRPLGEILSDISEKTRAHTQISRGDYLMTQMRVITTYIRLIFLPVNQNLDYDYPIYHSFFTPPVLFSCLFVSALLAAAIYLLYKAAGFSPPSSKREVKDDDFSNQYAQYYRLIGFGVLWFFISLSVESSIIPIVDVIFEHRVYLPSIGAFTAITSSLFLMRDRLKLKLPKMKTAFFPIFFIIVIVLSTVAYARNIVWQDEVSLWSDTVQKSPGKARAHANLGFAYLKKGAIDEAIEHINTALQLDPYSISVEAHNNLALAYRKKGALDKAIEECTKALTIDSTYVQALKNRGLFYADVQQIDAAISDFRRACDLGDGDGCMFLNYFMAARHK